MKEQTKNKLKIGTNHVGALATSVDPFYEGHAKIYLENSSMPCGSPKAATPTKIQNLISNFQPLTSRTGITLIALIITIIVMIILVAVTINIAINGGLFGIAKEAADDTEKAKFIEIAGAAYSEIYADKVGKEDFSGVTLDELATKLKNDYGYGDKIKQVNASGIIDITIDKESLLIRPGKKDTVSITPISGEGTEYYIEINSRIL